jgi:hypothetical protein
VRFVNAADSGTVPAMPTPVLCLVMVAALAVGCGGGASGADAQDDGGAGRAGAAVSVLHSDVRVTGDGRLDVRLRLDAPEDVDPPLAERAVVRLPAGTAYRSGAVPTCPARVLRRDGPGGCPRGAVIGVGTALGRADTADTKAEITVVDGGADRILLYVTMRNPARVAEVVEGRVADGRLELAIPAAVQRVAGVPVAIRQLRVSAGGRGVIAVGPCPASGSWTTEAAVDFDDGSRATHRARAACS